MVTNKYEQFGLTEREKKYVSFYSLYKLLVLSVYAQVHFRFFKTSNILHTLFFLALSSTSTFVAVTEKK